MNPIIERCSLPLMTVTILAAFHVATIESSPLLSPDLLGPPISQGASLEDHTQVKPRPNGLVPSQLTAPQESSLAPAVALWGQTPPSRAAQGAPAIAYGTMNFNLERPLEHPDRLMEGSGAGPVPTSKNQKAKLDDTEDSDDDHDDDDDEDYDDKDHRSTPFVPPTTQKPVPDNDVVMKRPAYSDFYNPFRPSLTNAPTPPSQPGSPGPSGPTSPPPTSNAVLNHAANQTARLSGPPAPQLAATSPPAIQWRPESNATHGAPGPTYRAPHSQQGKNKTETDYDYEDENEDDETEETSMFEDNDTSETDSPPPSRPTSNHNQLPSTSQINASRVQVPVMASHPQSQLPKLDVPRLTQPPLPAVVRPPAMSKDSKPTLATSKPHVKETTPSKSEHDEDDEANDPEEPEEDEEIEEDDEEEDGPEDDDDESHGLPERIGPASNHPSSQPHQRPTTTVAPPLRPILNTPPLPPANTHEFAIPPAMRPSSQAPGYQYSPSARPASLAPPVPYLPVTTTVSPVMPPIVSNSRPATQPIDLATGVASPPKQVAAQPTLASPQQVQPPPAVQATRPPPYAPVAHFPTTLRPPLAGSSFPTKRVVTPMVTTNIQPYDRGASGIVVSSSNANSDDSLTRQIYNKALETYQEADKTVRAAVDAVWPPNFNFDSSALEPLLSQPIFFMLALGGAIICLVLLMMLLVYMISCQTKPRHYEHDDISIY